jgi:glycosyltransferase involved in cell wall biosynthesis
MESVFSQTFQNIEYIVIDGGSADGSVEFIESNRDMLAYWISEADKGIYDAMNKGIDQSSGDYLLFLNSGDWLVDELVIEKFVGFKPIEGIVYGDPLVRNGINWKRKFMPKKMSIGNALTHTLNHQAEFFHSSIFKNNYRYDTSYKMVSDWIFTNNAIIFKNCTSQYIDLEVCYFEDPGISSDFKLRLQERKRYLKENFDPLFLKILKEYQILSTEHQTLKKSVLIKIATKLNQKKAKLINFLKNKHE